MKHIGIFTNNWGDLTEEQAKEFQGSNRIFYCGLCSKELNANIYHNLIGEHRHFNLMDEEFLEIIKDKINE